MDVGLHAFCAGYARTRMVCLSAKLDRVRGTVPGPEPRVVIGNVTISGSLPRRS